MIKAVVSDFGGVVTLPLMDAFKRAHAEMGVPVEALAKAMALVASRAPEPPLWTLERGQMSEPDFIAVIAGGLSEVLGRPVDLDGYGARLMASLEPNEPLLAHYRAMRARGVRLAILTNNVREWHDAWRQKIPAVDELFELIVDSGFEGTRKPEPRIYELTLVAPRPERPTTAPSSTTSRSTSPPPTTLGMHGIHFRETAQVIAELDALERRQSR